MDPSWQDIDVKEFVHKALNPLVDFSDALSGWAYVSVSYLKPVLQLFNEKVLKPEVDDSVLTKTIKATVISYLNEKYNDVSTDDHPSWSSFQDPLHQRWQGSDCDIQSISQADSSFRQETLGGLQIICNS